MYQKRNKELEIIALYKGNYKSRFYLRQISLLSELPLKTTQNVLTNLEKNKILKSEIEGKNKYFSLNLDNIKTKSLILQSETYKTDLFLDNYPHFKIFMKELDTNTPIIIFGSFAKIKAGKNSDVDMLIISEKEKLPFHLLPYKIHNINLTEDSFISSLKNNESLIREIKENHIILNNHSFLINLMWSFYGKQN